MEKRLSELIPQSPDPFFPPCEYILTPEEEKNVLDHFVGMEKKSMANRMAELGEPVSTIDAKLMGKNWLAELDTEKILKDANQRKVWQLEAMQKKEAERKLIETKRQELLKEWDANKFYRTMKEYFIKKHGHYSPVSKDFEKAICFFMSNDGRFETELGYSFNKGLLIQGTAGLGKTETIRSVSNNPLWSIKIHSILEISEQVKETGECEINTNRMILIDDVGTEAEVINHYGTKINWFKDFIETYYLNNRTFSGLLITTNLGGEEIEKRYGYRVRSRMREMFNVINLTGTDLRK